MVSTFIPATNSVTNSNSANNNSAHNNSAVNGNSRSSILNNYLTPSLQDTSGYGYLLRDSKQERSSQAGNTSSNPLSSLISNLSLPFSIPSLSIPSLSARSFSVPNALPKIALNTNPEIPLSIPQFSLNKFLPSFNSYFCPDLAIDLGTTNTQIYIKDRGIVINEPSIVTYNKYSKKPIAAGLEAKKLHGKTSEEFETIRPIKNGVISHFSLTQFMIQSFIKKSVAKNYLGKPRVVIAIPSKITQVEKRAVVDAAICAGARDVKLIEEPLAAALGAKLPVQQPVGSMIVDIGGGTTDVAILCLNGTVYSHSIRIAGDEMDLAIRRYLRRHFGMQIGIYEAEHLKKEIGSALPFGSLKLSRTSGTDIRTNFPLLANVSDEVVRDALKEPLTAIINCIKLALEKTNPEIAQDIIAKGITFTGGASQLHGLRERLERDTGIPFLAVEDPTLSVAHGVGIIAQCLKTHSALCKA